MLLGALASVVLFPPQDAPAALPADEQRAVFALLDRFDPLDTAKLPFVRVATGRTARYQDRPWVNTYRHGFLLESDGKRFVVRYLELDTEAFERTPPGTPEHERIGFDAADLRTVVAECLASLRMEGDDQPWCRWSQNPDQPVAPGPRAVLLARACARHGMLASVRELWAALPPACRTLDSAGVGSGKHDLADALADRLVLDATDPALGWTDLLARQDLWLEAFGEHRRRHEVEKRRPELAGVVDRDRAGRVESTPATGSAAAAVAALRDEKVMVDPMFASTRHWVIRRARHSEPAPMQRVIDLGLAAVPALIGALGDKTPTRTVVFSSGFGTGFYLATMSALAEGALEEIAGFSAARGDDAAGWRAWHSRATALGIRGALEQLVARGGQDCLLPALRLLDRWPDAHPVVLAALDAPGTSSGDRFSLLCTLADADPQCRIPRLTELLIAELRGSREPGPALVRRVLARGCADGVPLLLAECERAYASEPAVPDRELAYHEQRAHERIELLMGSGRSAAWSGLSRLLDLPAAQPAFLATLCRLPRARLLASGPEGERTEVEARVRACLLRLLADDEPFRKAVWFGVGAELPYLHEASVADIAACALAACWPENYPFDPRKTASVRRRQIAALRGEPAKAPRRADAKAPPNRVTAVVLGPRAAELPAAARAGFEALRGKLLTPEQILDTPIAAMNLPGMRGKSITLRCERNAGFGTALRVDLYEGFADERLDRTIGEQGWLLGSKVAVHVTASGREEYRRGQQGGEVRSRADLSLVGCEESLARALGAPGNGGVEIRVVVQRD